MRWSQMRYSVETSNYPLFFLPLLAVYLSPKRTNSRKLLFISILCMYIIFCVHIVKYLYKLMLCWKFHIIPMRNNQDMDHWNIYLHFLGHMRLGDSAHKCACAIFFFKYTKLWLLHWTFPFSKALQKIVFYFYFISFTMWQKKAAITNSIEWCYETDTCSVSHGSCNVKCYFWWMSCLCVL